jgi:hypothetical protein
VSTYASDPDYLAQLRALQLSGANAEADTRTQQGRVRRNLADQLPEVERQGVFQRQGIDNSYLNNGLFRSGMRQEGIARQQYDQARTTSGLQTAASDQVGDLESSLARLRAANGNSLADAGLAAQQREYAATQQQAFNREAQQREADLNAQLRAMQMGYAQQQYGAPAAPSPAVGAAVLPKLRFSW